MKSKFIIPGLVAAVVVGGGVFALQNQSNDEKNAQSSQVRSEDEAMTRKKVEAAAMEKEKMAKEASATTSGTEAMALKGSFSDYDKAKLANAEKGDVVLFFSASWCPTCIRANKNFNASATPDGLTLLKLNYDDSTDLKKKYGVTYQHTFVQVDSSGNQLKKWHGSDSYDELKTEVI